MHYSYRTHNTCSSKITFDLEGNVVRNVQFTDGCDGNLQAIQKLVEGFTVEDIAAKLGGTKCGRRSTSCADQLSIAVQQAYAQAQSKREDQ